jgi:hypothetical protein
LSLVLDILTLSTIWGALYYISWAGECLILSISIPFSSSKIVAAKAYMNKILSHSRQGDKATVTIYNS